jgi:hypothetical protein
VLLDSKFGYFFYNVAKTPTLTATPELELKNFLYVIDIFCDNSTPTTEIPDTSITTPTIGWLKKLDELLSKNPLPSNGFLCEKLTEI